jgi:hypothetical protein
MQIWTLAWDTDGGTGASVHLTEREAFMALIDGQLDEDDQAEAIAQLEDGKDFWDWFDENEREPMDTFSIESHTIDVPAPFNDRELATVLHSLRQVQDDMHESGEKPDGTHFNLVSPLTEDEIDVLCERLNLGPAQPKLRVVVRVEGGVAEVTECPSSVELIIEDRDGQDEETDEVCPHCGEKGVAYGAGCSMVDHDEPDILTCEDYDPDTDRTKAEQSSLPPDPEGTNTDRAEWAHRAILAFEGATGTDREDALADLLCDLMHWANVYGQDFERELSRATDSYAEETQADPDTEPEKPAPVEKHCYTCKWNQMADPSCITCNAETWPSWEPKEGQTITINPSAVAAMADKLGVII